MRQKIANLETIKVRNKLEISVFKKLKFNWF
jgi:hypothetical protein